MFEFFIVEYKIAWSSINRHHIKKISNSYNFRALPISVISIVMGVITVMQVYEYSLYNIII